MRLKSTFYNLVTSHKPPKVLIIYFFKLQTKFIYSIDIFLNIRIIFWDTQFSPPQYITYIPSIMAMGQALSISHQVDT
jgi:hypothetical protein